MHSQPNAHRKKGRLEVVRSSAPDREVGVKVMVGGDARCGHGDDEATTKLSSNDVDDALMDSEFLCFEGRIKRQCKRRLRGESRDDDGDGDCQFIGEPTKRRRL